MNKKYSVILIFPGLFQLSRCCRSNRVKQIDKCMAKRKIMRVYPNIYLVLVTLQFRYKYRDTSGTE
jgi:hypothetical protein